MQPLRPTPRGNPHQAGPQRGVASRSGKESAGERAIVESRAADEDRQPAARGDVANHRRGLARIAGGRIFLQWIGDVDEMVGDALPLGVRHLVRADVEAAVHRGRIAADDLAAEIAGQGDSKRALADGGGTEHRDQGRPRRHGAPCARANASAQSTASTMSSPSC